MEGNTGTRRLQPGALAARAHQAANVVSRKDLVAAAREAGQALRLRPTVRQVLGELAACYGEQALAKGLMVWPSNDYLVRKTGLSERHIRRCVVELIQSELIEPVDSANRKRFAVRAEGKIIDAYGFNLAPIHARRMEFSTMLLAQKVEREEQNRAFDRITICRKAVEEALRAIEDHFPEVDLEAHDDQYRQLVAVTPRRGCMIPLDPLVKDWEELRITAENRFLEADARRKESGRAGAGDSHLEQNNGQSTDTCSRPSNGEVDDPRANPIIARRLITISLILEACPAATIYCGAGELRDNADLVLTARNLRPSIGAHPDAWAEAVSSIGSWYAAALIFYVLQIHEDDQNTPRPRIRNPGGLYRDLVRRTKAGTFDLAGELRKLRLRHME